MRRDRCEVRFDHTLGSASPCGEGRSAAAAARRLRPGTLFLAAALVAVTSGSCSTSRDAGDEVGRGANPPGTPTDPEMPGLPTVTLTLSPDSPVVKVDGKTPFKLDFRVTKKGEDVTSRATLTIDNDYFGSFQGSTLNGRAGALGKTTVRAQLGNEIGSTPLIVRLDAVVIAPDAPADAPTKFGGGNDARRAPTIAYPPAGALMPPNINVLEFQWAPSDATLFELRLVGETVDLKIYTKCKTVGSGCAFIPDETTMKLLTQSARNGTVELTMRGSAPEGGGVGTSATQKLSFSDSDMKGGLYYWAASIGGIARYDFGLRGQTAESYYGPVRAVAVCVGCHAMSRNGKRIAVGMNIPGPAQLRSLETSTRNKLFEVGTGLLSGSNYQAFSPDGQYLVTTEAAGLTVRDGTSGMIFGNNPALTNANMPDFAPDGKTVVFARSATWCPLGPCTLSTTGASLFTAEFKGTAGFGPAKPLLNSGGENNYYPAFSPDGRYIVFNRAAGDSYDAADARVMVVAASGGPPIDLQSVNTIVGNSWPKWSPFLHRFGSGSIMWLTFSSRRSYGVHNNTTAQIWMLPVDVRKLDKGEDSGYPPFWLPFQDLNTGNHIPQWVEQVERAPCSVADMTGCGPNEVCDGAVCVPRIG